MLPFKSATPMLPGHNVTPVTLVCFSVLALRFSDFLLSFLCQLFLSGGRCLLLRSGACWLGRPSGSEQIKPGLYIWRRLWALATSSLCSG